MDCPELVDRVLRYIREAPLAKQGALTTAQYRPIPDLPVELWNELGDALAANERSVWFTGEPGAEAGSALSHAPRAGVPREWWISARFDIKSMGSQIKALRRLGLMQGKWDPNLHAMMQQTLLLVMKEWGASVGSTHSDECTILIPALNNPASQHPLSGNSDKINSLIAAAASSKLNRLIMEQALKAGLRGLTFQFRGNQATKHMAAFLRWDVLRRTPDGVTHSVNVDAQHTRVSLTYTHRDSVAMAAWVANLHLQAGISEADVSRDSLDDILPLLTFDCRRGVYRCERDALMLLAWRQWDCRRNGLSDAVYNEHHKLAKLSSDDKLAWLAKEGLLPLADGLAYGSLYERVVTHHTAPNGNAYTRKELAHRTGTDVITLLRDSWKHIECSEPVPAEGASPLRWAVFGSSCSVDYDVLVILDKDDVDLCKRSSHDANLRIFALQQQLQQSGAFLDANKKISVNIGALNDAEEGTADTTLAWCFKGLPDETNNAVFLTYHLHKENHGRENPIQRLLAPHVQGRCTRTLYNILTLLARTQHRDVIKPVLKTARFGEMACCFAAIQFSDLQWNHNARLPLVEVYKRVAFKLGHMLALLLDKRELCTKVEVLECFPDLAPALLRQTDSSAQIVSVLDSCAAEFRALVTDLLAQNPRAADLGFFELTAC